MTHSKKVSSTFLWYETQQWKEIEMASLYEQYIIEQDEDVFRRNWSSYDQAMMENKLRQIKKEVYEKICKELSVIPVS